MNHRVRRLPKLIAGLFLLGCAAGSGLLSTAWAYIPPAGRLPRLDIDMSLQFPDTVRTGDTVSISMTYRLLEPIPEPERGAATFTSINWAVSHCHGSFQFLDYAPWVFDTIAVGEVHTIERKIVPTKPGCAAVVGAVTSGIPWKTVRDTSYWGAGRFRNQVFDTVTIIGDSLDLTKVAIRHLADGTPLLQPKVTRSRPLAPPELEGQIRALRPGEALQVPYPVRPFSIETRPDSLRVCVIDWVHARKLAATKPKPLHLIPIEIGRQDSIIVRIQSEYGASPRQSIRIQSQRARAHFSTDSTLIICIARTFGPMPTDTVDVIDTDTGMHVLLMLHEYSSF